MADFNWPGKACAIRRHTGRGSRRAGGPCSDAAKLAWSRGTGAHDRRFQPRCSDDMEGRAAAKRSANGGYSLAAVGGVQKMAGANGETRIPRKTAGACPAAVGCRLDRRILLFHSSHAGRPSARGRRRGRGNRAVRHCRRGSDVLPNVETILAGQRPTFRPHAIGAEST